MYRDSQNGLVFHHGVVARSPVGLRLAQVVNYLFGVLYLLLGTRLVLAYVGAHGAPFVEWLDRITEPLFRPFRGMIADGHDPAGHPILWSLVAAIVAYALLNALLVTLLRSASRPVVDDV